MRLNWEMSGMASIGSVSYDSDGGGFGDGAQI